MGTWMAFTLFRNLTRLNPWLHLERLTVLQLVEKVPAVYENWIFITVLTKAHKFFVSWVRWLHSLPSHPVSWRPVLILSSSIHLGLPNHPLPSGFSTRPRMTLSSVQCTPHDSPPYSFQYYHPSKVWWGIQMMELLIKQSRPPSYYLSSLRSEYPPRHPGLKHAQPVILLRENKVSHPYNNRK
jgi:hypothetical protein